MGAFTVKQLKAFCDKEIKKGNGDKKILLSNDDEGNGYHQLIFSFTPIEKFLDPSGNAWVEGYIRDSIDRGEDINDYVVLG